MRNATPLPITRAILALSLLTSTAGAQLRRDGLSSLSDAEFWQIFTTMSEPGGTFPSENFISNELTFQHVIPSLQKTVRPDGVYLGVGPEQNFTYISNLKPRLAIIFDVRRQNAMAHLMYKAVFEMSPTRAEFVSRLFSRPLAGRVAPTAKVDDMFAVATAAQPSDSAYLANQRAIFANLVNKHHFVLTPGDSAGIEHLLEVFYEAGPDINYGYRLGRPGTSYSAYPTFATLQTRTNADSVQMAFLATEENYRVVRDMQMRNLIVPVVGNFAGPKAIRSVGDYLKQHSLTVQAFYLSNVEQYLFQDRIADQFYQNVAALPLDSTSSFIRSVPPNGINQPSAFGNLSASMAAGSMRITINNGVSSFMQTFDSAGQSWMRTAQDSGGSMISRLYRDSSGVLSLKRTDTAQSRAGNSGAASGSVPMPNIFVPYNGARSNMPVVGFPQAPQFVMSGGMLVSGLAPMSKTVDEFKSGRILRYTDVIAMTKLDGWK
jgi:hypothetical protein